MYADRSIFTKTKYVHYYTDIIKYLRKYMVLYNVRIYICQYIVTVLHSHTYGVILDMQKVMINESKLCTYLCRLVGIMLQIFIIILFQISSKKLSKCFYYS